MHSVQQLLKSKGSSVYTIDVDETVIQAAKLMTDRHIGSLIVTRNKGAEVAGIFTERDIMRRIVAEGKDPAQTRVRQVMTTPMICCSSKTTLDEVRALMREKKIRHVPVIDDGKPVGMIAIGDLNFVLEKTQQETIQYLEQYLYKP